MMMLKVIARTVGLHRLILLNFYPFLQKYVQVCCPADAMKFLLVLFLNLKYAFGVCSPINVMSQIYLQRQFRHAMTWYNTVL